VDLKKVGSPAKKVRKENQAAMQQITLNSMQGTFSKGEYE